MILAYFDDEPKTHWTALDIGKERWHCPVVPKQPEQHHSAPYSMAHSGCLTTPGDAVLRNAVLHRQCLIRQLPTASKYVLAIIGIVFY